MNNAINRRSLMRAVAAVPVVAAVSAVGGVVAAPSAAADTGERTVGIEATGRPGRSVPIPQRVVARHQPGATADNTAAISTVVNLGLSRSEAIHVQSWLTMYWGYTGAWDGLLGTNSWKAFQRCLKTYWGYTGAIDGIVGHGTISALQRLLKRYDGYTGPIDGIAGPGTRAAFKRFAA
ncbi:peptidoglycan-binding domain-containing protein [Microlunatus soli]|uniref:Putative peptidoglycan binding domain-containing protein n=1 Tax=Microlunatus soli TaxID=630515 RepID=A0A1H1RQ86_9ACTN|nr:peptidoglycan-binding domain-containing protein [Microlunatus soli]SDS37189.1 Putative peptidoglycan binding domain-containing protein [Microlunatus soli]